MIDIMKNKMTDDCLTSPFQRWWQSRTFLQQRIIRSCLSMLVMVICIPFYYLGLFGTVDGPLHPARIGQALANMGVTQTHSVIFFLSFLIAAVSWNWIYNLVSLGIGARLTCERGIAADGTLCGAPVKRMRVVRKRTGQVVTEYVCSKGHRRPRAHFHPIKKGTVSHTVWVISLGFFLVVMFA